MYHIETSARFQHLGTLTQDIIQITQNLVPRDRLGILIILDAVLPDHIGRIRGNNIKRRCSETLRSIFDIADYDVDLVLQIIVGYTA